MKPERNLIMGAFKDVILGDKRYVLVPFVELDSFCRSYEHLEEYAKRKKLKEVGGDEELLWRLISEVRKRYPYLRIIAAGQRLERFLGENEDRYMVAYFPDTNPFSPPSIVESDLVDVTHCEPEYEDAVCVFLA